MSPEQAILPCVWPAHPRVRAVITTRRGGVSTGPYRSFNLAQHVGDRPEAVRENRRLLARALTLPAEPAWLTQVHGTAVVRAEDAAGTPEADGSVTASPGVVCAVLTADCLPVLLSDRAGLGVAALHAGWRGLAAGVLEAGVAAMGCAPEDVLAWIGPGLGPRAFEVGPEVREAFLAHSEGHRDLFVPSPHARAGANSPVDSRAGAAGAVGHEAGVDASVVPRARGGSLGASGAGGDPPMAAEQDAGTRWLADLPGLARARLTEAGVGDVTVMGACTFEDPERWFSYRRDKGRTGRMATLIWLAPG